MISPLILEITNKFPSNIRKDIDGLISLVTFNPIWQTLEWQNMLRATSYTTKSFFVGVYEDKKLLSYALVEKRSIGLGQYGLFCIGGPIIGDKKSIEILSESLKELTKKEKAVFIQTE